MFDYKVHLGTAAWLFHRISGLALIFYMTLHVWVVHHLAISPEKFNEMMLLLAHPVFKFAEVGLLAAVMFHSLNGIRVILVEYTWGNKYQKELFGLCFGISAAITVIGGTYLLWPIIKCYIG